MDNVFKNTIFAKNCKSSVFMRYICNIISKAEKYRFNRFINLTTKVDDIDRSIPTIAIGVSNAEKLFGGKLDYINRFGDNNSYWTFATTEKRSENERDVDNFKKMIVKSLKKRIKYQFFNVLLCSRTRFKKFINFLNNDIKKAFYFTNKMLYIAYGDVVMGISLDDCEYIGVRKRKIYDVVKKHFENVICTGSFLTEEEKEFFGNDDILIAAMFCYANS